MAGKSVSVLVAQACSPGAAKLRATLGEILTNIGLKPRGLFQEPAGEENETKLKWYIEPSSSAACFSKCCCYNFPTEESL